jgi:hypothetical protein
MSDGITGMTEAGDVSDADDDDGAVLAGEVGMTLAPPTPPCTRVFSNSFFSIFFFFIMRW